MTLAVRIYGLLYYYITLTGSEIDDVVGWMVLYVLYMMVLQYVYVVGWMVLYVLYMMVLQFYYVDGWIVI